MTPRDALAATCCAVITVLTAVLVIAAYAAT